MAAPNTATLLREPTKLPEVEGCCAAPEHVLADERVGLMCGEGSRAEGLHRCGLVHSIQRP